MRRRRPGRWLPPLALVIVAIAVYAIVQSGSSNGGSGGSGSRSGPGSGATTSTTSGGGRGKAHPRPKQAKPSGPATYTVQQGDTLVAIAAKTGVSLGRLELLNPGLNASAMHIGQRIRLRR